MNSTKGCLSPNLKGVQSKIVCTLLDININTNLTNLEHLLGILSIYIYA